MEKKPKVSIILPVHNVERYLDVCVKGILAQTFTDFECILVDDGSTDGTPAMCDDFAKNDSRFVVIHQQNKRLPGARNTGIEAARGDYIGFVDGDDYIHPDMFRLLVENLEATGADFSVCQAFRSSNQAAVYEKQPQHECRVLNRDQIFEYWFISSKSVVMWTVWNHLYTREIIGDTRFNDITPGQDQDFNFRIYLKSAKAAIINEVLYNWSIRDGSITEKYRGENVSPALPNHINLLRLVDFIKYTPNMTERERGYFYKRMMRNIVRCRALTVDGDDDIRQSLREVQSSTAPSFFKNKTVSRREKALMRVLLHVPCTFKVADWLRSKKS